MLVEILNVYIVHFKRGVDDYLTDCFCLIANTFTNKFIQAKINRSPPIGVMGPMIDKFAFKSSWILRRYIENEKQKIPETNSEIVRKDRFGLE